MKMIVSELCEAFADYYELPVDYVYSEFINPLVDDPRTVQRILFSYLPSDMIEEINELINAN